MIEPLTRPRPPVVEPTPAPPVAYLYADVLEEIRFNGSWQSGRVAGGLLVGAHYRSPEDGGSYVEIEGFVAGAHADDVRDFGRHLRQQWRSATATLRYHFPEAEVVGWYLSWSGRDPEGESEALLLHNTFFSHPWQIALQVPADDRLPVAMCAEGDGWRSGTVGVVRPGGR